MKLNDELIKNVKTNALMYEGTSLQGRSKLMEQLLEQANAHIGVLSAPDQSPSSKKDSVTALRKLSKDIRQLHNNLLALGGSNLSGVTSDDVSKVTATCSTLVEELEQAVAQQELAPDSYRPEIASLKSPLSQAQVPRYEKFGPDAPESDSHGFR